MRTASAKLARLSAVTTKLAGPPMMRRVNSPSRSLPAGRPLHSRHSTARPLIAIPACSARSRARGKGTPFQL